MFDLTDPIGMLDVATPESANASTMLCTSTTSPTRVDVPWPSIKLTVAGSSPACAHARSIANLCPIGLGAVIPLPFPSLDPPMPRTTA